LQTEARAAYEGIQHAAQLGMINIVIEIDATMLAVALKSMQID
jgi:hypothetical protein